MAIAFESLYSDIGGRIGKLTVGKKTVRTPALLPVINPHLQLIPPKEMQDLGVEALITNAYIFSQSRQFRDRALNEGLHRVLDFDGVIMTDSGSFQLSVYGEVSITNTETLSFQRDIGSDIWVPLDIPTSPAADRDTTERDLAITLDRLAEAKEIFGPDAPLAGPVQGGTFTDLRKSSAKRVTELGFAFCPVGAVVPLMESYRYRDLVRVVMASKEALAPSACVHLFGAGHPSMFALATAMGCDLFDSAAYALYAKDGRYLTAHGSYRIEDLSDLPCSCKVCRSHTAEELRTALDRERLLSYHNLYATLAEIARVRQAISDGTLWELVDERCRAHPRLLDGYRELLTYTPSLAEHDRVSKRRFFYRGDESCSRTEVMRYQQQIARLPMGPRILVVIDGRAAEGYSDTLLFKPPFGPYPVELKETFPIGPCEIPDWDDAMVRQGCRGIRALAESHPESTITIACSNRWAGIVRQELAGMEIADDEV